MILRCAIYTRKSSEEGLGQDFNSLQAQREACEAYVTSQKHEGWQVIKDDYDDGGFSGGNIARPGLQKLLKDIDAGKVNIVVVYKVDRLTRSLADFAKIIEQFDKRGVSFVSVTQQFNTTSSMGRLTLNVLLSFAQFEREVTGERIRDKIAASKQKGMFMGGNVPLGYKVEKRKLRVVPEDTEKARHIFRSYLKLGSIRLLHDHLMKNKIYSPRGKVMSGGALRAILTNVIYIGQIRHKDKCYPGQHAAIIDQELWDKVQQQLSGNRIGKKGRHKITAFPLAHKLFDISGERLMQTQARKEGRRYRYYISERLFTKAAAESPDAWRMPAAEIENTVAQTAIRMLQDHKVVTGALHAAGMDVHTFSPILARVKTFCQRLASDSERADALATLVKRVEVKPEGLTVTLQMAPLIEQFDEKTVAITLTHEVAMRMQRRGVETKMIISGGDAMAKTDPVLIRAVVRGRIWFEELVEGKVRSIGDIVKRDNVSESHVGNLLPLAFLAPDIVEAIMIGSQPLSLTLEKLTKHVDLQLDWEGQQKTLYRLFFRS